MKECDLYIGQDKNLFENFINRFHFLLLVLTINCKLRCRMCFNWKNDESNEIESKYLETVIYELYKNNFLTQDASVNFAGGEPLLREDVFELIKFTKELGLHTALSTSGYIYTEEISKKIKESGLDCIALPLDSLDKKKHDYLRGTEGVFQNTMRIIKEHPKKVSLTCTISAYNIDEICKIAQWVESNDNISSLGYQAIVFPFNSDAKKTNWFTDSNHSHLWPKDFYKVSTNLDELMENRKNLSKIHTTVKHLNFFKEYFRDPCRINKEVQCRLGDYSLTIMNKGDVVFCNYMEPIGNIKEANIIDILSPRRVRVIETKKRMLECRETCEFYVNCFFED